MQHHLKIMSFNIRHGRGTDMKLDLGRTAAVIRESGADIVFLQEVDSGTRRSEGQDQAGVLAATSGLHNFAYGKNLDFEGGGYGNALLSRLPIAGVRNHPIPPLPTTLEQRGVLQAVVEFRGEKLHLFDTHYPLTAVERTEATHLVLSLVGQVKGPVVFGGDLNAEDDSPEVTSLAQQLQDGSGRPAAPTFPADTPQQRIDYLFYRGPFRAESFTVIETQASDHLPIMMELVLK